MVSHSGGRGWHGGTPPSTIFFETPPIKTNASPWGTPELKNEAPRLKCEAPSHEMIPRKSTNNNLKCS